MQEKVLDLDKHLWLDLFLNFQNNPEHEITLNNERIYSRGLTSRSYDPTDSIDLKIEKKSEEGMIEIQRLKINGRQILPLFSEHTNQKTCLIREKGIWHLSIPAPLSAWYKTAYEQL